VLAAAPATAEDVGANVHDITEVSLTDLLNTDVEVASKVPQTFRETPGVITVITREEIMDSGARDLEDVLLLVPGFSLAIDVEGVTDVGVRGNWGHEGKVLLLVDGQQMNENLYSTNQLGNHYPIDQIERIEIIRGPGSAIYGGYAELAVINIVTRGADELNGTAVYGMGGLMGRTLGHANLSLAAGQTMDGVKLSIALLLGRGIQGNSTFTDLNNTSFPLEDMALNPTFLNIGIQTRGLSARFIYDGYRADEQDGLAVNEEYPHKQTFTGYYGELKYDVKPQKGLTVTPKLNYLRQIPWQVTDPTSLVLYDKTDERLTAGASASYDVQKGLNVLAGAEMYWDHAFLNEKPTPGSVLTYFGLNNDPNSKATEVTYYNQAVYAQGLWNSELGNLTVGARYEHHSQIGSSFVPRIALTKLVEPFHVKLLYSEAFRAPGFEDINLAPNPMQQVQPEHTRVVEAEGGYSIDAHNFLTINAFYINLSHPIVYYVDSSGAEFYTNFDYASTTGVEADYKARYAWGYLDVNYSYYRALANRVPVYQVAGHDDVMLGMPSHKLTFHGAYKLWKELRFAPSMVLQSGGWGYLQDFMGTGTGTLAQTDASVLLNTFFTYRDLGVKGLEVGAGLYNIVDSKFYYLQPYGGYHAPMRGMPQELVGRIGYTRPL
jgi:outer membrane cobalamin receptor